MSKELLKEVVESLVDEETIKQIIGDKVSCLLEEQFEQAIRSKARELTNILAKEKVEKIIDECLLKEVVVNDGWNPRKKYESFEELVKERIFEQTKTSGIERAVSNRVDDKIRNACKKIVKDNEEKFAEQVLDMLGGNDEL